MSELKFACPHCQQHIAADTGYAGMQINCPSCQGLLMVPGAPAAPAPVPQMQAPPPPPAPSPGTLQRSTPTSANVCPSCNSGLPRGAMLCTVCGYNFQTKQRMVAGRPAAMGKPRDPHADNTPWYKTPWPYVGGVMLILGLLYVLGRGNPPMMLAFVAVVALYSFTIHILVVISAFKESVTTGILTLCIGIYTIYYVFKVNENNTLKILYGSSLALWLAVKFAFAD